MAFRLCPTKDQGKIKHLNNRFSLSACVLWRHYLTHRWLLKSPASVWVYLCFWSRTEEGNNSRLVGKSGGREGFVTCAPRAGAEAQRSSSPLQAAALSAGTCSLQDWVSKPSPISLVSAFLSVAIRKVFWTPKLMSNYSFMTHSMVSVICFSARRSSGYLQCFCLLRQGLNHT